MEPGLIAVWVGIVASGIVGVGGLIVGIIGIKQARRSNQLALVANEKAEAANKLSNESNIIARQANSLAVDANELSKDANTILKRSTELMQERSNVMWELRWKDPRKIRLINRGEDEALRVHVVVEVDGNKYVSKRDTVAPGTSVAFTLKHREGTHLIAEYLHDQARVRGNQVPFLQEHSFMYAAYVSFEVTWESVSGKVFTRSSKPVAFTPQDFGID